MNYCYAPPLPGRGSPGGEVGAQPPPGRGAVRHLSRRIEPTPSMNEPAKPVETETQNERLGRVRAFWNWLRRTGEPRGAEPLSPSDLRLTRATFRDTLAGTGGEASARQRVATLAALYRGLNDDGPAESFLGLLAEEFGPDELAVNGAIQAYLDATGPVAAPGRVAAAPRARQPAHPHRQAVQPAARRREVPRRPARRRAAVPEGRAGARGARRRAVLAPLELVRHRQPRAAAHQLELARGAAREADRLRGGARDPLLDAICATGSTRTAAATRSSTRACPTSR